MKAIVTRKEAIATKSTRYFTGKPCKHGHVAERFTSNRECKECHDIRKGYIKPAPVAEPKKEVRVVSFAKVPRGYGKHRRPIIVSETYKTASF